MKKILCGNLKLNCSLAHIQEIDKYIKALSKYELKIIYAVPFPYLSEAKLKLEKNKSTCVFAQDISEYLSGPHTGEVSSSMLKDLNIDGTIIGHSERRFSGDNDEKLRKKLKSAVENHLNIIFCIGESEEERNTNKTLSIVDDQINIVLPFIGKSEIFIAYEPVWAIGTGKIPNFEQLSEVFDFIFKKINNKNIPLLYGGSVTEKNCKFLCKIEKLSGFLVGGCSSKEEIIEIGITLVNNTK